MADNDTDVYNRFPSIKFSHATGLIDNQIPWGHRSGKKLDLFLRNQTLPRNRLDRQPDPMGSQKDVLLRNQTLSRNRLDRQPDPIGSHQWQEARCSPSQPDSSCNALDRQPDPMGSHKWQEPGHLLRGGSSVGRSLTLL